jgi:hypothetical protein
VGLRAGLDRWGKSRPRPGFDPLTVQPVASCYTNYAIAAHDIQQDKNLNFHRREEHSFEGVEEFKYLGTTLTNHNCIQVEVKSRLKLRNACYHSVQELLSSRLLSKNLKIKIYRTIILPVVLYGCESWSLT